MSKHKVIVKNLSFIQNLGDMDILCCDKTGTLTQDKVTLERHMDVMGREDDEVLRRAYLNSRFQTGLCNLIDHAIIDKARQLEDINVIENQYTKVDEIPFDFKRRRMRVVVASERGVTRMVTKGVVEEILAICTSVELDGEVRELTNDVRKRVQLKARELSDNGMRVIAVAQRTDPHAVGEFSEQDECDMILIGYLAFLDPPKVDAAEAIRQLRDEQVVVKVLTSDNERVVTAVCNKVGIDALHPLLDTDLDSLTGEGLARRAETTQLFAKLSPAAKSSRNPGSSRERWSYRWLYGRRH